MAKRYLRPFINCLDLVYLVTVKRSLHALLVFLYLVTAAVENLLCTGIVLIQQGDPKNVTLLF